MSEELRARMAALKATAALSNRKPSRDAKPAKRIYLDVRAKSHYLGGRELQRIKDAMPACNSISQQVALIMGYDFDPIPDYEHDRCVAYVIEEWLRAQGAKIEIDTEYYTQYDETKPKSDPGWMRTNCPRRRTTVWFNFGRYYKEEREDHNLALCHGAIAVFAAQWHFYCLPDEYYGLNDAGYVTTRMEAQYEAFERQGRETLMNPRGT